MRPFIVGPFPARSERHARQLILEIDPRYVWAVRRDTTTCGQQGARKFWIGIAMRWRCWRDRSYE